MDTLIASIIIWLSANFGLPETSHFPTIKLVSPHDLIEARAAILDTEEEKAKLRAALGREDNSHGFVALYDDTSQTIYLPKDWSAASPVDMSILVHEMVHHLQNVAEIDYPCKEGREYPAYQAQQMWLKNADTTLEREFDLDAMTLLVLTKCWFGPP